MGKPKLLETRCSPCYIYDMMHRLQEMNAKAKLAEIEAMGFAYLMNVPKLHVNQGLMVKLARAFDVDTNILRVDVGRIEITGELIGRVFGLPSAGDDFPAFDDKNPSHVALKQRFHRRNPKELRQFVYDCPMNTESDRLDFRRHFILVVLKMFLCPTTQQVISPWHLPPILDVSNPTRFIWPMKIFSWLKKAIKKYKNNNNKTCEGCVFVLLILYFQRLKHGDLVYCMEPEPWISAWTATALKEKSNTIISEGCLPSAVRPGKEYVHVKKTRPRRGKTKVAVKEEPVQGERKTLFSSDDDDDDNESIAKRMRRLYEKKGNYENHDKVDKGEDLNMDEASVTKNDSLVIVINTPSTTKMTYISWEEMSNEQYSHHDFVSVVDSNLDEILAKAEQEHECKPIIMEPIQTVHPDMEHDCTRSSSHSSYSIGMTQILTTPTPTLSPPPTPPTPIHPLMKGKKVSGRATRLRNWIFSTSLDKHQILASYDGRRHVLYREDLCTLAPRNWVNNNIVRWMCFKFNDSASSRFTREFYCVSPGILEMVMQPKNIDSFNDGTNTDYEGLGPQFGKDNSDFDKVEAARRKWWFFPVCFSGHWWVYAFEVAIRKLLVLDSIHAKAPDAKRMKIDAYAVRLIEDIAKVAIPSYAAAKNGITCSYAKVPIQRNSWDCGIYAIKFMQYWRENVVPDILDYGKSFDLREELWLDIIFSEKNLYIEQALKALDDTLKPKREKYSKKQA